MTSSAEEPDLDTDKATTMNEINYKKILKEITIELIGENNEH